MNKTVNDIITIFDSLASGKKLNNSHLQKMNMTEIRRLFLDFMFLLSYPENNRFYNKEAIDTLINDSKLLISAVYKKSNQVKEIIEYQSKKENEDDRKFEKITGPNVLKNVIKITATKNFYHIYSSVNTEEESPIIKIETNKIICDGVEFLSVLNVPLFFELSKIKEDDGLKMADDSGNIFFIDASNSKYRDVQTFNNNRIKLGKTHIPQFRRNELIRDLYKGKVKYIKQDNKLIVYGKSADGAYDYYKNYVVPLNSYYILDKNKNVISISDLNMFDVLKHIRICIAHSKNKESLSFIYKDKKTNLGCFSQLIIFKDKILSIPEPLYERICDINYNYLNYNQNNYSCCYCPKLNYMLDTDENINRYLKNCKIIQITADNGTDLNEIDAATQHYLECYNNSSNNKEIKEYLTQKLKEIFPNVKVSVNALYNTNVLADKISKNPWFKKFKKNYYTKATAYISFIVKDLYEFEIVKSNIDINNKIKDISISKFGILELTKHILSELDITHIASHYDDIPFELYKDEIVLLKCLFLAYVNLVDNNFDDDFDTKKSKLSVEEKFRLRMNVNDSINIFNDVRIVNDNLKGNDKERNSDSYEDGKVIISTIRNKIAHFEVYMKYSKSGNMDDNELVFKNSSKFYYKIKCKDFIELITNPLFVNYNIDNYEKNIVHSFEEFQNTMVSTIEEFEP